MTPERQRMTDFWLYVWEDYLLGLIEQVWLMQFCRRNAERRAR